MQAQFDQISKELTIERFNGHSHVQDMDGIDFDEDSFQEEDDEDTEFEYRINTELDDTVTLSYVTYDENNIRTEIDSCTVEFC